MSKNFHPFSDMAESARAQHQVDKANFQAAQAEARASWEEARMSPKGRQALIQQQREQQIAEAEQRKAAAQARIDFAKEHKRG